MYVAFCYSHVYIQHVRKTVLLFCDKLLLTGLPFRFARLPFNLSDVSIPLMLAYIHKLNGIFDIESISSYTICNLKCKVKLLNLTETHLFQLLNKCCTLCLRKKVCRSRLLIFKDYQT